MQSEDVNDLHHRGHSLAGGEPRRHLEQEKHGVIMTTLDW